MPDLKTILGNKPTTLITTEEKRIEGMYQPSPISLIGREVPSVEGRLLEDVDSRFLLAGTEAVQEIAARNQNAAEQWVNGVAKFVGKTGTAIIGSTLGTIDGIFESITSGEINKLYDNHVNAYLDGLNKDMDAAMPNLRTKVEEEMSLGRQLLTSNFWADDFLGGASFMVGAVATEFLTAGLVTPAIVAKAGSALKLLNKANTAEQALVQAGRIANTAKVLGALKSTIVSAGYESAMEAYQSKQAIMNKLVAEYKDKNGTEPDEEILKGFEEAANDMANDVFAANLVTVGAGNAIFLSKIFGQPLKNLIPTSVSNVFSKGLKSVDGKLVDKSLQGWKKYYTGAKRFLVNPLVEGGQEMAQGLYQSSALDYVMDKYSHDGADASYSLIDALETNGLDKINPANWTKDQMKEGLVGALLGLIGLPGTGSFLESFKGAKNALQGKSQYQDIIDRYNSMPSNVKENLKGFVRQHELNKATNNTSLFEAKNNESLQLFNFLGSRYNAGYINDVVGDAKNQLDGLKDVEFAEAFGYEKLSKEEIKKRKEDILTSLESTVNEYKAARERADRLDYTNNEEVKEGLAYTLFGIKDLDKRFDSIVDQLEKKGIGGAKSLKDIMVRGNSITFREAHLVGKKEKLDKTVRDRDAFIKDNKRKVAGYKAVKTKFDKTYNKLFGNSPVEIKIKEYEDTVSNFDKLITKQEKELKKYEQSIEKLKTKQKGERGTSEIDKDLDSYDQFLKELRHYKDLTPEDKLEIEEEINDLNRIASKRKNLIDELSLLSDNKAQKKFAASVDELKERTNREYELDVENNKKRTNEFLIRGQEEMAELEEAINTTKNQNTKKKLINKLEGLKRKYKEFENVDIANPEIENLQDTVKSFKGNFTSSLFKNMYDIIRAGKQIKGEQTEEDIQETLEQLLNQDKKPIEKPKGKSDSVFSNGNDFFIVYQDYLKDSSGELKGEVKKAMESYEGGAKASIVITETETEPISSNSNDEVFIQRGIAIGGKQYFVNISVDGIDIGGLMNPDRYTMKNDKGEFVSYDLNNPVHFKKLNSTIVIGSKEHKEFLNKYNAIKHFWNNVIKFNIEKGNFTIPFAEKALGGKIKDIKYTPKLNVYTLGTGTELQSLKDIVEQWGIKHKGKKILFAKWGKKEYVFKDDVWNDITNDNSYAEIFERYNSAKKANRNNRIGEKGGKGFLVNVEGVDKVFPLVFPEVDGAENTVITNWIKNNVGNKDAEVGPLEFEGRITLGITKGGNNKYVEKSYVDLVQTSQGTSMIIQSPAFGTYENKEGETKEKRVYLNILKNGSSGEYFFQYKDGNVYVTATIGKEPTVKNILGALGTKLTAEGTTILDAIKDKYQLDNLVINFKSETMDNAMTNVATDYNASLGMLIEDNSEVVQIGSDENLGQAGGLSALLAAMSNEGVVEIPVGIDFRVSEEENLNDISFGEGVEENTSFTNLDVVLGDIGKGSGKSLMKADLLSKGWFSINMLNATSLQQNQMISDAQELVQELDNVELTLLNDELTLTTSKELDVTKEIETLPEEDDVDVGFKILPTSFATESSFTKESSKVQRVLGNVEIRDVQEVLRNISNRGLTMGAFANGVVYLSKYAAKGTGLHEAFHYVFRGFLTESELDNLYKLAEQKYGKPTKEQLVDFRQESSTRKHMFENNLVKLWYEEKMANEFASYSDTNIFSRLFNKVKALIKKWLGSIDEIELLFHNIDMGKYKNRTSKYNSDIAFSIKGKQYRKDEAGEYKTFDVGLSSRDSKMIASLIFQQINKGYTFEQGLNYVINRFDTNRWKDVVNELRTKGQNQKADELISRIIGISSALSNNTIVKIKGKDSRITNRNLEANIEELQKMVKSYEAVFTRELDEDNMEDERDETTELFSRGSDRGLGFTSLSKIFRQYIGTIHGEIDYFNLGIEAKGSQHDFPVDVDTLYNGLLAFSRNLPEDKIFQNLLFQADDNVNVRMFVDRWTKDIGTELGMDNVTSLTHAQLKESQWYNTVVKALTRTEEQYVDAVIMAPNQSVKYSRIEFFNSNQTDTEQIQKSLWYSQAKLIDVDAKEVASQLLEDFSTLKLNVVSKVSLENKVIEYKDAFESVGVKLSKGLIRYSILKKFEEEIRNDNNEELIRYLDSFDVEQYITKEVLHYISEAYKNIAGLGEHHSNIFVNENKGASGRYLNLAKGNAYFDETVRKTTIRNSQGENVYPIKLPSFDADLINTWKREGYKFIEEPTFETLVEIFPTYPEFLLRDYYESIKNNLILKNNMLDRMKLWNLFGIRNGQVEGEDQQRIFEGAAEYSEMDASGKMFTKMSMFITSPSNASRGNHRLFVPAVLEAKNTAKAVEMPVGNFTTKEELSKEGLGAIRQRLEVEKNRINRVKQQLSDWIDYGIDIPMLVKDYHYRDIQDKKIFRLDGKIYEIVNNQPIEIDEAEITNEYREIKGLVPFEFKNLNLNASNKEIQDWWKEEFDKFVEYISSEQIGLIKNTKDGYKNRLLPWIKPEKKGNKDVEVKTNIVKADGEVMMDRLFEFFTSDYINSMHFMNLLYGNPAMQHKDEIDIVKRNGGLIGSGESIGSAKVAYIQAEVRRLNNELISKNNKDVKQDVQDAQSYTSLSWFVNKYLKESGRLSLKTKEIMKKLRAGISISKDEFKHLQKQASTAIDKKPVIRDLFTYIKTSAHTQLRETYSYLLVSPKTALDNWDKYDKEEISIDEIHDMYKAYPGYEYHHEMLNLMERAGIEMLSVTSAGKNALINVGKWNGTSFEVNPFEVGEVREQVKMESIKNKIVDGTQKLGLIDAEQSDDVIKTLSGQEIKVSDIAKAYRNQLAKRTVLGVNDKRKKLYKDGEVDYDMLNEEFDASINSSAPDPMLSELAKVEGGKPVYSWNLSVVSKKFQQIFHKYISSQTLKFKVEGTKYTLVSDYGINVMVDENDEVVPKKVWAKDKPNLKTRPLAFGKKENGIYYSECIVPQWVMDKFGIKLGEEIKDEMLLFQMGIRIPTQDKHSMVTLKVVDTIPSMNESSIILPAEIVFLSGADFDIDSLFTRFFATSQGKRIGTYTSIEEAYNEWAYDKIKEDKDLSEQIGLVTDLIALENDEIRLDFKNISIEKMLNKKGLGFEQFKNLYAKQVEKNIEARNKFDYTSIEPLTIKEADNILLELELHLVMNEGNKDIASTKASLDLFTDRETGAIEYFKSLGLISNIEAVGIYDALSKNEAQNNNDVGKAGIGPVALFNILFQKLYRANINYEGQPLFGRTAMPLENEDGERQNNVISTILTAMTDNAKERIAAKFNLSTNTLGTFMTIVSTGIPFKDALLIMNQPVIKTLEKNILAQQRSIKTGEETKADIKGKNKFHTAVLKTIEELDLPSLPEGYEVRDLHKSLETREAKEFQSYVLDQYVKANEKSEEYRKAATIISLIKGLKPTIGDNKKFIDALNGLGIKLAVRPTTTEVSSFQLTNDGAYFKKGDTNYKVELSFKEDAWFMDVMNTDKHLFAEVMAYAVLSEDVGEVFFRQTNKFQNLVEQVKNNLNPFIKSKELDKMEDYFVSYLNILAYKHEHGINFNYDFLSAKTSDGEYLLHKALTALKGSREFRNSPLLRMINQGESNHMKMAKIGMDTMSEQSPEFKQALLNEYVKMLDPKTRIENIEEYLSQGNTPSVKEWADWFASKIFQYTFVMDNMTFRNQSLVKSLDPLVWKRFAQSLQSVEEVFKGNKTWLKVTNKSEESIVQEFVELYLRNPNRYDSRVFASTSVIRSSNRKVNKRIIGQDWFQYEDGNVVLDFSTQGKFDADYVIAMKEDAANFGLYRDGVVPQVFNFKASYEAPVQILRLETINLAKDEGIYQYRRLVGGKAQEYKLDGKAWKPTNKTLDAMPTKGYKFSYKSAPQLLSYDFVGFAQSVVEAEELTNKLSKTPVAKVKQVSKEGGITGGGLLEKMMAMPNVDTKVVESTANVEESSSFDKSKFHPSVIAIWEKYGKELLKYEPGAEISDFQEMYDGVPSAFKSLFESKVEEFLKQCKGI